MVNIIIENLGQKELRVNVPGKTALQLFQSHFIDWLHTCGGKGRCTTCKMAVVRGMENLSEPTVPELIYRQQGLLKTMERLACQAKINGTVTVRVPDETKLAHVKYSA